MQPENAKPEDAKPEDAPPPSAKPGDGESEEAPVESRHSEDSAEAAEDSNALDATQDFANSDQLVDLLDSYLEQVRRGETPDREALKRQHPALADRLDECLAGLDFIHGSADGSPVAPLEQPMPERRIGDFRILAEVGRGGMGAVYEAQQISLNRKVAVKILRYGTVSDPQALERFQREAETVAKLHHTNIVPIFSVGNQNGVNYYAMQFIEGLSLDRELKKREGQLDSDTVADWGLQAAEALAHAHARGVIHRDVKPSNLILDEENRIWLTDFGLAKRLDDVSLSLTGALLGTPRYMSPEQASATAKRIDHRTDIYSLGATLYELITGKPVFMAETPHGVISQILNDDPIPPRSLRAKIPKDLETIILKCLAKNAGQRYESMKQVADDLRAYVDRRPIQARRASPLERASNWLKRKQRSVASSVSAAAITVLLIALTTLSLIGYQRAQMGELMLTTETAPLVAEMLDQNDEVVDSHTVPTQRPFSTDSGGRRLRLSSAKSWSRTYHTDVRGSQTTRIDLRLDETEFGGPLKIEKSYALVRTKSGGQLLLLEKDGLRLQPVQMQNRRTWLTDLTGPLNVSNSTPKKKPPAKKGDARKGDAENETPQKQEPWPVWPWAQSYGRVSGLGPYDRRPFFVGGLETEQLSHDRRVIIAPDLNGDGHSDFIMAARHQAWVQAFSGADGKRLWLAFRGLEDNNNRNAQRRAASGGLNIKSAVTTPPALLRDLNSDGVQDLGVTFISIDKNNKVQRWIEAISGKDGEQLWRRDLEDAWFNLPVGEAVPKGFMWFDGSGHVSSSSVLSQHRRGQWTSRRPPTTARQSSDAVYVNGRIHQARVSGEPRLVLVAGDQFLVLDPETGDADSVTSISLRPGTEPRLEFEDGNLSKLVFLEMGPPPKGARREFYQSQLTIWSLALGKVTWQMNQGHWPAAYGHATPIPRWPLLMDIDGDGQSEIISASTSSWTNIGGLRGLPRGRVAVYDTDGKLKWDTDILTLDQQANQFSLGPDINQDGFRELFVAAPWGDEGSIYVEALSGEDGKCLWTREVKSGGENNVQIQVADMIWRQVAGPQNWELIVHVCHAGYTRYIQPLSLAIDPSNGQVQRLMRDNPRRMHVLDFDSDGSEETVSFFTKTHQDKFDRGGELRFDRGLGAHRWSRVGGVLEPTADLNGDGVNDVLSMNNRNQQSAFSGADGSLLWSVNLGVVLGYSAMQGNMERRVAVGGDDAPDINGDGVPDLLYSPHAFSTDNAAALFAISGRTGRPLWVLDESVRVADGAPLIEYRDLEGDGKYEIIFSCMCDLGAPRGRTMMSTQNAQLWLLVLNAKNGAVRWKRALTPVRSNMGMSHLDNDARLTPSFGDLNGDGVDDMIMPHFDPERASPTRWAALSGADGKELWSRAYKGDVRNSSIVSPPPAAIADLDGDGKNEGVLLQVEEKRGENGKTVYEGRIEVINLDGGLRWSWATSVASDYWSIGYNQEWYLNRNRPIICRTKDNKSLIVVSIRDPQRGGKSLVVINDQGLKVREIPYDRRTYSRFSMIELMDIDGDERDELFLLSDSSVSCFSPSKSEEPLWKFRLQQSSKAGLVSLQAAAGGLPPLAIVRDGSGINSVYALDATNGELLWKCPGPTPKSGQAHLSARYAGLLRTPSLTESPIAFFSWNNVGMIYEGQRPSKVQSPIRDPQVAPNPTSNVVFRGRASDARWERQLPWAEAWNRISWRQSTYLVSGVFISLAMVLAPGYFLLSLIRKRTFGMKAILAVFVFVGVFLFTAFLPLEDIPPSVGLRFMIGLYAAGPIVFAGYLVVCLSRQQWRPILIWCSVWLLIFVGIITATVIGMSLTPSAVAGQRLSLKGAWLAALPGAQFTSMIFVMQRGAMMLSQALQTRSNASPKQAQFAKGS